MRYIDKSNRCVEFDTWVTEDKPENWRDFPKYPTDVKHVLHNHLWREQQGLCVYCQQAIPEKKTAQSSEQIRSHIEHIRPRSLPKYSGLTFDYSNLSVSCQGFDCAATGKPKQEFCEHRKANEYDENLFLHPVEQQDIEDHFEYNVIGEIYPNPSKSESEQQKANYMIKILALNHKTLTQLRARAAQVFNGNREQISGVLNPNDVLLPEFYSMLKFLFPIKKESE